MGRPLRHPRGQQRDKIYREALRLELADMSEGVDLKKLRQIARAHIEKAASGDMQAIKELANRLDGKPAQILDLSDPDTLLRFRAVFSCPRRPRRAPCVGPRGKAYRAVGHAGVCSDSSFGMPSF